MSNSMTSNESHYTNDNALQSELFLVTVLLGVYLGVYHVEERF